MSAECGVELIGMMLDEEVRKAKLLTNQYA